TGQFYLVREKDVTPVQVEPCLVPTAQLPVLRLRARQGVAVTACRPWRGAARLRVPSATRLLSSAGPSPRRVARVASKSPSEDLVERLRGAFLWRLAAPRNL